MALMKIWDGTEWVPFAAGFYEPAAATASAAGIVELATTVEAAAGSDTTRAVTAAGVAAAMLAQPEVLVFALGDETTTITTGAAKVSFRMPFAFTVTEVRASLNVTSSSGTPTFDINDAGVSILSTKLTIDVGELTSTTAAVPPVISDTSLADDALITIDIDTAGTGAKGAKIAILGRRA